mgnify:CR=1 FL=1
MNINKDTLYTIDWQEKSGSVLRKDELQFLFGYNLKDHSKVYFKYFENSPFYDGKIKEMDVSKGKMLLAKMTTKTFKYSGELLETKSGFHYIRRSDINDYFDANKGYRTKLVKTEKIK